jgi:DNA-binding NarL/FixJ family response regulator
MNRIELKGTFVIADPHFLITMALKEMLAGYGAKVHTASGKQGLVALLRNNRVSLVIADHLRLFNESIDELSKLIRAYPDPSHLVLTSTVSKQMIMSLHEAGIRNIALRTDDRSEIINSVRAALAGQKHYSREVLDLLVISEGQSAEKLLLTPSEIEIVAMLSAGLSVKDIAERKQVGLRSVMKHRQSIYRKLGVTDANELKRFAIRVGLIDNIEYHI